MENIKRINEIILNTYDTYNNNYYNSIKINGILLGYMKNDYIKNKIMKNILKNKYDKICEIILQKKKVDLNIVLNYKNLNNATIKIYNKKI